MIDNGMGGLIPDGNQTTITVSCRISYETMTDWTTKPWVGGLTTAQTPYLLAAYNADVRQEDILVWRGVSYKVGLVTRPHIDSGDVCTQAPLTIVEN
jgi:hypothetical protein